MGSNPTSGTGKYQEAFKGVENAELRVENAELIERLVASASQSNSPDLVAVRRSDLQKALDLLGWEGTLEIVGGNE